MAEDGSPAEEGLSGAVELNRIEALDNEYGSVKPGFCLAHARKGVIEEMADARGSTGALCSSLRGC